MFGSLAPFLDHLLLRKNQTRTLVHMSRESRWEEVKNAFCIQPRKEYKHLLLVDDVITTLPDDDIISIGTNQFLAKLGANDLVLLPAHG